MATSPWLQKLSNLFFFPVGTAVGFQSTLRMALYHRPIPMPHYLGKLLDHPLRLRYRDPVAMLGACGIAPGETVADVGCGTGLFTVEMARLVGASGQVHAVDFQPPLLAKATSRIAAAGFSDRVHFHLCRAEELPLPNESTDMAVLVAALGETPDPPLVVDELYRVLKPGGRVVVSEELLDPAYLPRGTVRRVFTGSNFRFAGRQGNFFCYYELYFK